MKHLFVIISLLFVGCFNLFSQGLKEKNGVKYQATTIILKVKNNSGVIDSNGRMSNNQRANSVLKSIGVSNARQLFKEKNLVKTSNRKNNLKASKYSISNIYKLELDKSKDLQQIINSLGSEDWVEYAELAYSHDILSYTNNLTLADDTIVCVNDSIIIDDTYANQQFGHTNSQVYEAWCLEKGDTSVIVGVVDTGCRTSHLEFQGQLQYNWAEKNGVEGVDDDMNGFVDDTLGYDVAEWDNDVSDDAVTNTHGTEVASIIASKVGNNFGTIGVGYNTRVLPVKISNDSYLRNEYEGVMYAVENGARIVNLSWGRNGFPSKYEQDIINYVTEVYDVMVVAAAGNTNGQLNFYPASYQNVLSAAHNSADETRFSGSTYSYFVDMQAAGNRPVASTGYTNQFDDGHQNVVGSSYASPFVAGIGALVANHYPDLKATQIAELLRITSDDKYHLAGNTGFEEKLGRGQVNAYRALTERNQQISVRMTDFDYDGAFGHDLVADDTLDIFCDFQNFLEPTSSNLQITLTTLSGAATVVAENQTFDAGSMDTMQEKNNSSNPFKLYLHSDISDGHEIYLRLGYSDGDYTDYQYFIITYRYGALNVGFFNNNIALGTGSNRRLGHIGVSQGDDGMGLTYSGAAFLEEAGLILSTNSTTVSDAVLSTPGNKEEDFAQIEQSTVHQWLDTLFSVQSSFEDYSKNNGTPIGVEIEHKVTWQNNTGHQDYVAVEYDITNVSGAPIDSLHVALFADWDMPDAEDFADWDTTNGFGYVYNDQNNYVGLKIHNPNPSYFAFDMTDVGGDNINVTDEFSTSEKHQAVSNGIFRTKAGYSLGGSNVAHSVGTTVYNLQNDSTYKVHFIIMGGTSLADLQEADTNSDLYLEVLEQGAKPTFTDSIYCVSSSFTISPSNGFAFNFYDSPEMDSVLYSGPDFVIENPDTITTYYVTNIDKTIESEPSTIRLRASDLDASFDMVSSLNLYDSSTVHFSDLSSNAVSWFWDFGDGNSDDTQNPLHDYADTGTFDVSLTVMDTLGCTSDTTKQINVFYHQDLPVLDDTTACINNTFILTPQEAILFKFYDELPLTDPIYEGETLVLEDLANDTTIYFTGTIPNTDGSYENIVISVSNPIAEFTSADVFNLSDSASISFTDNSTGAVSWSWDFGDGVGMSTNQNPSYSYILQGDYLVTLLITDEYGCTDQYEKEITVVARSPEPGVANATVCIGSSLEVIPENGSLFNFYESSNAEDPLVTGSSYTLSDILINQSLFISNIDSAIESSRVEMQISISDPIAEFTSADVFNLSDSASINFTDNSTGAVSWSWNFGDGVGMSTDQNPSYSYIQQGDYLVTLVITDEYGCTDQYEKEITVVARSPEPGVANATVCIGSSLEVIPENGSLFNFYESSNAEDPMVTGSSYTLSDILINQSLFISNIDSAIESGRVEMQISISDPIAEFTSADVFNLSDSASISFTDNSTGAVSWSWNFGDGVGMSTDQNPSYSYIQQGDYLVTLVITDEYGCTDQYEKEITVVARSPEPGVANATVCIGSSLEVIPENGSLFNFYESSNAEDPMVTGSSYTLSDILINQSLFISNIDSAIESGRVEMQISISDPIAEFTSADVFNLSDSASISFTDNSTGAVSWSWNFGDGVGMSTDQNPSYSYSRQGTFVVSLTINNDIGCSDSYSKNIKVVARSPLPQLEDADVCLGGSIEIYPGNGNLFNFYESQEAATPLATGSSYVVVDILENQSLFISNIDSAIESSRSEMMITVSDPVANFLSDDVFNLSDSVAISFTDNSPDAIEWFWDFGDGIGTSSDQNPEYSYAEQGTYNVTLTIISVLGCSDQFYKDIEVVARSPLPGVENKTVCLGEDLEIIPTNGSLFRFYDQINSENPIATGSSLTLVNLTFSESIFISSVDSVLESDRVEMVITVNMPIAGINSADTLNLNDSTSINFWDNSVGGENWNWDFGDGMGTSNDQNPVYAYNKQGVYIVTLEVESEFGCVATVSKNIYVINRSTKPIHDDIVACLDLPYTIIPSGGSNFKFYSKDNFQGLLGTGSVFTISSVIDSDTIFITSIDSVLESEPVMVKIIGSKPVADFTSNVDSLNILSTNEVIFTSSEGSSWLWDFDNGSLSNTQTATATFSEVGEYNISLTVYDSVGCENVITKLFKVYSDALTAIPGYGNKFKIEVYPNPAFESFHLVVPTGKKIDRLQMIDIAGKERLDFVSQKINDKDLKIDISGFPKGLYFIRLEIENTLILRKIVKY